MQLTFAVRSMADPFVITDTDGQACYQVRSVPDVAERLSLRAAGDGESAAIVRDAVSGGFQVLIGGEREALVRARGLVWRQYLIEAPRDSLSVQGNVDGGTYALYTGVDIGASPRVQVRRGRAGLRSGARYVLHVTVAEGGEPVRLTAIVLGIEYLCEDRRQDVDELRTGLRVISRLLGIHH